MVFLLINKDTKLLTDACIKSLSRFLTDDDRIVVWDNSEHQPYFNTAATVIDNTRKDYIDFDYILSQYPDRDKSLGRYSKFGSFKHCISVERALNILGCEVILCDTDILFKKDPHGLIDPSKIAVGKTMMWCWGVGWISTLKMAPWLCYLNYPMMVENGITYYNQDRIVGLYSDGIGENYDTGGWLMKQIEDKHLPYTNVDIDEYCVHFKGASYTSVGKEGLTPEKWLVKYSTLL